jgi:hypothetical protein
MKKGSVTGERVIVRHPLRRCECGCLAVRHPYNPRTGERGPCAATCPCRQFAPKNARAA